MGDEPLNQDQIDALLQANLPVQKTGDSSPVDLDAVGEISNIAFGTAATTLSVLLNQRVLITTPMVSLVAAGDSDTDYPPPYVVAEVEYTQGLKGVNILAITAQDAAVIADLMLGGDGSAPAAELTDLHLSAVAEAMNQMMGSAATSLATMLKHPVNISPPAVRMMDDSHLSSSIVHPPDTSTVKVSFQLKVGDLIDSRIMHIAPLGFVAQLVRQVRVAGAIEHAPVSASPPESTGKAAQTGTRGAFPRAPDGVREQPAGGDEGGGVLSEAEERELEKTGAISRRTGGGMPQDDGHFHVESAQFSDFEEQSPVPAGRNLDLLLDISLGVTVELGRTRKLIRDILDLAKGSVVELDTVAGEPVDILVNEKLIARGEVVVIDENFGVRVTDIVSPAERLRKLR